MRKRKSNQQPLKEAIEDYLKAFRLKDKVNEADIKANWDKIVGSNIADRTTRLFIKQKTLYIQVNSAVLRQELLYSVGTITNKVNEYLKEEYIDRIHLM